MLFQFHYLFIWILIIHSKYWTCLSFWSFCTRNPKKLNLSLFIFNLPLITSFIIYPTVNGQSPRTIPTTWPYNILWYWYGRYWTVVIAQLSEVDLPCKVNDKSRWLRKASEWGAGPFCLIVCKQNKSVNILFIINNIITYALRIVLIN